MVDWVEDDGWLTEEEKRRIPDPNRGQILPFKKTEEGLDWAVPQFMIDMYNAITLPRDVLKGYQPTPQDNIGFALDVGLGGAATSAALVPDADLGMFLGKKAKGAKLDKLSEAIRMTEQGVPREEIWNSTGWWLKPDGQWAWEMSDENFDFAPNVKYELEHPEEQGVSEVFIKADKGLQHPELFEQYRKPDRRKEAIAQGESPFDARFHPDELVDFAQLSLGENLPNVGQAQTSLGALSAQSSNMEDLKGITLHELQHFVQDKEGWLGRGSNQIIAENMEVQLLDTAPDEWKRYNFLSAVLQNNTDLRVSIEKRLEKEDLSDDTYSLLESQLDLMAIKNEEYMFELAQLAKTPNVQNFEKTMYEFYDKFGADLYDRYRRNEGEALANITAARKDLTDEQRKGSPPWNDFGLPDAVIKGEKIPKENQVWTDKSFEEFKEDVREKYGRR